MGSSCTFKINHPSDRRKVFDCRLAIQGPQYHNETQETLYPVPWKGIRLLISYKLVPAPSFRRGRIRAWKSSGHAIGLPFWFQNSDSTGHISFPQRVGNCSHTQDSAVHDLGSSTEGTFYCERLMVSSPYAQQRDQKGLSDHGWVLLEKLTTDAAPELVLHVDRGPEAGHKMTITLPVMEINSNSLDVSS
jgi:hypothetical protein